MTEEFNPFDPKLVDIKKLDETALLAECLHYISIIEAKDKYIKRLSDRIHELKGQN